MKQRIDSDLRAAIKKLYRRVVVDICFCNYKAVCIGRGADIADFGVLHIYTAALVQAIIACAKRN